MSSTNEALVAELASHGHRVTESMREALSHRWRFIDATDAGDLAEKVAKRLAPGGDDADVVKPGKEIETLADVVSGYALVGLIDRRKMPTLLERLSADEKFRGDGPTLRRRVRGFLDTPIGQQFGVESFKLHETALRIWRAMLSHFPDRAKHASYVAERWQDIAETNPDEAGLVRGLARRWCDVHSTKEFGLPQLFRDDPRLDATADESGRVVFGDFPDQSAKLLPRPRDEALANDVAVRRECATYGERIRAGSMEQFARSHLRLAGRPVSEVARRVAKFLEPNQPGSGFSLLKGGLKAETLAEAVRAYAGVGVVDPKKADALIGHLEKDTTFVSAPAPERREMIRAYLGTDEGLAYTRGGAGLDPYEGRVFDAVTRYFPEWAARAVAIARAWADLLQGSAADHTLVRAMAERGNVRAAVDPLGIAQLGGNDPRREARPDGPRGATWKKLPPEPVRPQHVAVSI